MTALRAAYFAARDDERTALADALRDVANDGREPEHVAHAHFVRFGAMLADDDVSAARTELQLLEQTTVAGAFHAWRIAWLRASIALVWATPSCPALKSSTADSKIVWALRARSPLLPTRVVLITSMPVNVKRSIVLSSSLITGSGSRR